MEARIEELMGVIKKKLIEEIIRYGPQHRNEAANAAGVRPRPSVGPRSPSPQQNQSVKESLNEIKNQIKRINTSLRAIEDRQSRSRKQYQYQCKCSSKQLQHRRSDTASLITSKHIKTYGMPSHLDDHQVRQALYNPEMAKSEIARREQRRSHYDQIYEESERRIQDLARSVTIKRARSKIGGLLQQDRRRGKSKTQKHHHSQSDEDN